MPNDANRQAAALRQAVLLLSFVVAFGAMLLSLFRGSDLLHAAYVALWVLPVSSFIIYHVFRTWFLVLMRSIHEKQLAQQQAEGKDGAAPQKPEFPL